VTPGNPIVGQNHLETELVRKLTVPGWKQFDAASHMRLPSGYSVISSMAFDHVEVGHAIGEVRQKRIRWNHSSCSWHNEGHLAQPGSRTIKEAGF